MKKELITLMFIAGFALISCKKEETKPEDSEPTPTPTPASCTNLALDAWCIGGTYYTAASVDDYTNESMSFDATSLSPSMSNLEFDISDTDSSVTAGAYTFFFDNFSDDVPANMMAINVYVGSSTMYTHKNNMGTITVTDDAGKRIVNFTDEYFYNVMNASDSIKVSGKVRVR